VKEDDDGFTPLRVKHGKARTGSGSAPAPALAPSAAPRANGGSSKNAFAMLTMDDISPSPSREDDRRDSSPPAVPASPGRGGVVSSRGATDSAATVEDAAYPSAVSRGDQRVKRRKKNRRATFADEVEVGDAPRKVRSRTRWEWFVFVLGIIAEILIDVALLFTPSVKRRQRRYGGGDDGPSSRGGGNGSRQREPNRIARDSSDDNRTRRGTAGARQRALDRNDVPEELRGLVSAARWRSELKAYHEEQVKINAAREKVMGEVASDTAAMMRKKARAKAAANVLRASREMR
jgi:hypothetical protein